MILPSSDLDLPDRPTPSGLGVEKPVRFDPLARSRRSVAIDLKRPEGVAFVLDLVREADALIEGFRPGTMERLGLGPDPCLAARPSLVYGRVTGCGQTGRSTSRISGRPTRFSPRGGPDRHV